jgi:hypothetical protein
MLKLAPNSMATVSHRKRRDNDSDVFIIDDTHHPTKRLALQLADLSLATPERHVTNPPIPTSTIVGDRHPISQPTMPMGGIVSHGSRHTVVIEDLEEELREEESDNNNKNDSTIILHVQLDGQPLKSNLLAGSPIILPPPLLPDNATRQTNALVLWRPALMTMPPHPSTEQQEPIVACKEESAAVMEMDC